MSELTSSDSLQIENDFWKMDYETFIKNLDKENRWVILEEEIYWEPLEELYCSKINVSRFHPEIHPRTIIAAFIVKYKLKISTRATVRLIRENQYIQYFTQSGKPFGTPEISPELLRNIRDLFGKNDWAKFKIKILEASYSGLFGKSLFKIQRVVKDKLDLIQSVFSTVTNVNNSDKALHESAGLEYPGKGRMDRREKRQLREKKRRTKKIKKAFDYIIWTILISLVIGSLVLIVVESDWSKGKKKTEKIK